MLITKKDTIEREKPSPFECGFDPIRSARVPFSVQFFLVAVIFLIFDVELTLILPAVSSLFTLNASIISSIIAFFLLVLLVGLYIEWNYKALDWYI